MTDQQQQQSNNGEQQQQQQAPAPAEWFSAEQKDYVGNKGWKSGADAIGAYQNLESLIGADRAGRTIVMPKDDKDVEGTKAFRAKLGVPDSADAYQLPVPQGSDGAFAKVAAGWMHELGVPLKQAQALTTKWNEYVEKLVNDSIATDKAKSEEAVAGLKKEWGDKFDGNSELGRRFANTLGVTAEELNAIEGAIGTARMLKLFHGGGTRLGEPAPGGGNNGEGKFNATTQQQAQKELADLQTQRIAGTISDKDYNDKVARLGPIAYPDRAA